MPDQSDYFDFSFSGLKTAVVEVARSVGESGTEALAAEVPHIAASFQSAAVDVLVSKTLRAVEETGCTRVVLGGGVTGKVFHASPRLSLDNGAMVARAARFRFDRGDVGDFETSASARLPFPGLRGFDATPMPRT
jgi:N6-L-threonylcarbamoyladenine synthase